MKKGWKVVLIIFLVVVVLGTVCMSVGMMTGAETARIYSVLDDKYHIEMYYNWCRQELCANWFADSG